MKKWIIFVSVITAAIVLLSGCGRKNEPINTPTPVETQSSETDDSVPNETSVPSESEKNNGQENTVKSDDAQTENHEEISKMIKDAKELIDEGLTDDAAMLIRDLLTRNLTEDERSQVEALQSKTVKISD